MAHIFISAAHKSSGKTTISLGLIALLKRRGLKVSPFKKGPDYIDPIWHSLASNSPCNNLDTFVGSQYDVVQEFCRATRFSDISLIEGNKGLYDGVALDGSNSNAAVAKLLNAPVILVIDCRGMTRGIAPLLMGYEAFDPDVNIAGVIFNRVGGDRHESKLRASVEHFTQIPVIGAIHESTDLRIDEQHLGLIPGNELDSAKRTIKVIADTIEPRLDIDLLQRIADSAIAPDCTLDKRIKPQKILPPLRIAVAKDAAFGFYYPSDFREFKDRGAELIEFSPLQDKQLPDDIDGIFLGGGFPERHAGQLSKNSTMLKSIRDAIENGLPSYAECGGLMYLTKAINWNNDRYPMAGVIKTSCTVYKKPQGRGYVELKPRDNCPWMGYDSNTEIRAHEFHYSRLDSIPEDTSFAYEVKRGHGITGHDDGLIYKNLLASYTHMRHTNANPWVQNFLEFVQSHHRKSLLPYLSQRTKMGYRPWNH